jgi:hypothetical protein
MTVQIAYARRPLARRNSYSGLSALGPDEFEGYASLFGVADSVGDRVAPGAFAASLRRRGPAEVRMLYQHFAHAPIGVWEEIREDNAGLYVRGRLSGDVEQARDVRALLADGALNGLSIGCRPARRRPRRRPPERRPVDASGAGGGPLTKKPRVLRRGASLDGWCLSGRGGPKAFASSSGFSSGRYRCRYRDQSLSSGSGGTAPCRPMTAKLGRRG